MENKDEEKFSKDWENATLANNFIFYKVMRNHPEECKWLIEKLLGIKIESFNMHNEEVIDIDLEAKAIRLDIYVQDSTRIYDIEMQIAGTKELPERSRYYSSLMSLDNLKAGEKYDQLKDGHVIFICLEDIFKEGLPVYTFENICLENGKTKLNDRDYKHFFIAPICANIIIDQRLKEFFEFLTSNSPCSDHTSKLKEYVNDAKHNMQWRHEYMTIQRMQAYAYDEGLEKGAKQQAINSSIEFLKMKIGTPTRLISTVIAATTSAVPRFLLRIGKPPSR